MQRRGEKSGQYDTWEPPRTRRRWMWTGMGWDGMGWDGMEWNGMEWNGRDAPAYLPRDAPRSVAIEFSIELSTVFDNLWFPMSRTGSGPSWGRTWHDSKNQIYPLFPRFCSLDCRRPSPSTFLHHSRSGIAGPKETALVFCPQN
jgi:hypothetical protein